MTGLFKNFAAQCIQGLSVSRKILILTGAVFVIRELNINLWPQLSPVTN